MSFRRIHVTATPAPNAVLQWDAANRWWTDTPAPPALIIAGALSSGLTLSNGAGALAGTLLNAPAIGNPTKWIPINDNGTTRYLPAW